jgi:hypothetical protein
MYPGEYTQPLVRKHFVQCPVISGYVTARLQAEDSFPPTISGAGTVATSMFVTFENVGGTAFSVILNETSDRSIAGARTPISGYINPGYGPMKALTLVPGGSSQGAFSSLLPYLEVKCTGSGPGSLRMQLESQRQWRELGFDRVDDATFYPTVLWQAKEYPGPVSSP